MKRTTKMLLVLSLLLLGTLLPQPLAATDLPDARNFAERGARTVTVRAGGADLPENSCFLYESVTYVPLLVFCRQMGDGADTSYRWQDAADTATLTQPGRVITARTGDCYINVNGRYFYGVTRVLNWDGVLYVPVRAAARAYGAEVAWDPATYGVTVSDTNRAPVSGEDFYRADELYWLSRIISAESRGEPMEGRLAVGNVVLNRVRSGAFPNTIYGVIFDRKYGVQFTPVANGTIYEAPTAGAVTAAKMCLEGYTLSEEVLYFCNPVTSTSTWLLRTRPEAFQIANHRFFY